jgi:hypothetical protein
MVNGKRGNSKLSCPNKAGKNQSKEWGQWNQKEKTF